MLSKLIAFGFAVAFGPVATLTGAGQDCAQLVGDAGIAACSRAIRENPRDSAFYFNRGMLYKAEGDIDQALSDYTKAIALRPNFAVAVFDRALFYEAHFYSGELALQQGRKNEAMRVFWDCSG